MKKQHIISKLICLVFVLMACSKPSADAVEPDLPKKAHEKNFYIVGYMFSSGNLDTESAKLDFGKITHLNIAFINPDENGLFPVVPGLAQTVKRAHDNKVKVLVSIGGGSPPEHLKSLLVANKRAALINELVKLTTTYNLDGVDVDLEGSLIDENYEPFVVGLSNALKSHNKLMTSAVATWNGDDISDKALRTFDFINIMSYDQTGPWRKEEPGPHSTYEAVLSDFLYWNTNRSVPASKITMGLPFYGYGFGPSIKESYSYGEILRLFPGAESKDIIEVPGQGTIYYNGLPTIQKKVKFALDNKLAGVMIWQLFGDAAGDKSLLSAINAEVP